MKFELDTGGYPTEAMLESIRTYSGLAVEFFRGLKDGWWSPDFGYREEVAEDGDLRFRLSTGGWSGNEDTIAAMEDNLMLQMLTWEQSTRGGHYIYEFSPPTEIVALYTRFVECPRCGERTTESRLAGSESM